MVEGAASCSLVDLVEDQYPTGKMLTRAAIWLMSLMTLMIVCFRKTFLLLPYILRYSYSTLVSFVLPIPKYTWEKVEIMRCIYNSWNIL